MILFEVKVALVHDYLKEYGGAERVLEALHELYPDSPVFTIVYLPEFLGPHKKRFIGWEIRESWVRYVPFRHKLISPLRLIAPFLFRQFDFSEFDVVIVSATGAYNPNVIKTQGEASTSSAKKNFSLSEAKPNLAESKGLKPVHICYCHTPPRYLYGYATAREWKNNIVFRILGEVANHFLRMVDFKSAQNVDYFIANSSEVASRIKKFYRRDSTVIFPPVEIDKGKGESTSARLSVNVKGEGNKKTLPFTLHAKPYFLAGGRLARPKHIDLIIEACAGLNVPLKVFGRGFAGYEEELKKALRGKGKASSIELVGEVSDEEKFELMRNAKAYIFASEDEDFGITPIEAMSVGTPVIAYRSGGVQETVIDGKTGFFFDELSVERLTSAIKQFNNSTINPKDCINHARKFSKERFKKEIEAFVSKHTEKI